MRLLGLKSLFVVFLAWIAIDAAAQSMEEIIVTGSRASPYDDDTVPVVHLKKRPDYMVVSAFIESDSRNAKTRIREVEITLASLAKRAGSARNIELGLSRTFETDNDEIEYVVPFSMDDAALVSGYRPDTSRIGLIIKSPVLPDDSSPDSVYARIEAFIESIDVEGRAVVSDSGDPNFSLVDINQYREPLIELIAADSKKLQALFGAEYRMSIGGFEESVRWRVSGPMELAIYFPYYSSVGAN